MAGLVCQMGERDRQHFGAGNLRDRLATDAREDMAFKAVLPPGDLSGLFQPDRFCSITPPRRTRRRSVCLPCGACRPKGHHQRGRACGWRGPSHGPRRANQQRATESELATPAADDEALDPAAGAGGLNVQIESVAVDVVPRRRSADEGGRGAPCRDGVLCAWFCGTLSAVKFSAFIPALYAGTQRISQDPSSTEPDCRRKA